MVLKEPIFNGCTSGGCGGLEGSDLYQCFLLEGVVVLKELIFSSNF